VNSIAWSPDSKRIASASWDKTVQIWDATTGGHVFTYGGDLNTVFDDAEWSPYGKYIASIGASDEYDDIQVWDATNGSRRLSYHSPSLSNNIAWSPDGTRLATAEEYGTVHVWDANTGSSLFTYLGHRYGVWGLAWSPDGVRIASGGEDKTVQVWDATDGGHVYTYRGHKDDVNAVAWSPDGKLIASAGGNLDNMVKGDSTVQVWQAM